MRAGRAFEACSQPTVTRSWLRIRRSQLHSQQQPAQGLDSARQLVSMAEAPSVTNPKAQIFIGTGAHGVDKLFILPAPSFSCREQLPAAEPTAEPLLSPSNGVVAFFVGDQVEDARQPPRVRELQDPRVQAALTSDAFPGAAVAVVMPSRLEGGCACFDHFLHRTTATGEPLGYRYIPWSTAVSNTP